MKKFIALLILSLVFVAAPNGVSAQTETVDDSNIEQRLGEEGLNEAPEAIELEESTIVGEEETSGFVDDEGNPISADEFEQIREEESGTQWANIALVGGAVVVLAGGIALVAKSNKSD